MSDAQPPITIEEDKEIDHKLNIFHDVDISVSDVQTCIKVLNAISALKDQTCNTTTDNNCNEEEESNITQKKNSKEDFESKYYRPLRKAVTSAFQFQDKKKYNGMTKQEFRADKDGKKRKRSQKAKDTELQRRYIETTLLRKGRTDKLNQLLSDAKEEELAKLVYLVPDGVGTDCENVMMLTNGEDCNKPSKKQDIASSTDTAQSDDYVDQKITKNEETTSTVSGEKVLLLPKPRSCYICKIRFRELHPFYDQLCPTCAELNLKKRNQSRDLKDYVAIVTGSRVKIGFHVCLKLLRAGATVIATTRFPHNALQAYVNALSNDSNFKELMAHLHIYGLDLRDVVGIETFVSFVKMKYGKVDILINNACQTIRRPCGYYTPLVTQEVEIAQSLFNNNSKNTLYKAVLEDGMELDKKRKELDDPSSSSSSLSTQQHLLLSKNHIEDISASENGIPAASNSTAHVVDSDGVMMMGNGNKNTNWQRAHHSALLTQVPLLPEDSNNQGVESNLKDINGHAIDLRIQNSWLLKMEDVTTPELIETMFVNTIAPFILSSRLKLLMTEGNFNTRPDRYVINVSAMEGKFYRYKTANHPHTNMAKAALNMMTRTSSEELAKKNKIYMNSIDTGWINDENPLEKAKKIAKENCFQTPIDEIDAAARILDTIFTNSKEYGKFFKDYRESEW